MSGTAKRLTLTIGIAALVAAIVGSVIAPELLAAPSAKTEFVITTSEKIEYWGTQGTWKAGGALKEAGGNASSRFGPPLRLAHPDGYTYGEMVIDYDPNAGTFIIAQATGEYAHLQEATGTYWDRWVWRERKLDWGEEGTVRRTLEGSVP